MAFFTRNRAASLSLEIILLLVLGLLTVVQYKWSRQVSDAARAHVDADLRRSILAWHMDLFRSLAGPPIALRLNTEEESQQSRESYATRFLEWRARTAYPALVSNIYIWNINTERHPRILRLNPATGEFKSAAWQQKFGPLCARLRGRSSLLDLAVAGASSPEEFFADHSQRNRPFQITGSADDPFGGWVFDPEIPALFHPIAHEDATARGWKTGKQPSADWMVIEYSSDVLRRDLLPELTQRYFSGKEELDYDVTVVAGTDQSSTIYSSESSSGAARMDKPDATMSLFGPMRMISLESPIRFSANQEGELDYSYSADRERKDFRGAFWFPVIHTGQDHQDWYLLIKHRHGSLSDLFVRVRRKDLAISFGILLLLITSMGLVIVASRRAQRLAKLQVDFVAGVSHDLRTPLAVISLAADNLADGLVDGHQAVISYGATLQAQVRQLAERVEQVLLFAATERNQPKYSVRPVELAEVVDTALRNTSTLIDAAGVLVDLRIEPGLPPVLADHTALALALQNLVTNGVKYGGDDRWLGIQVKTAKANKHDTEIQVVVEDHGAGIQPAELHRVFEPFYRSPSAIAAQVRGTGLGLTLAKSTVEAFGGSISISSVPDKGSKFIVHLPLAERKTYEDPVEACTSVQV